MSKNGGQTALVTCAMIIAAMRFWLQIRGKTTSTMQEWLVGWGATFFILSIIADVSPGTAGVFAITLTLADFLKNGVTLTNDLEGVVTGATKGSVLPDNPISSTENASTSKPKGK